MTNNPIGEFLWRMIGSIIGAFCREFGVINIQKIVTFIAHDENFWKLQTTLQESDPTKKPFERGAHDWLKKNDEKGDMK